MPSGGPEEREVRIHAIGKTPTECIVFLEEIAGIRLLPIWIGMAEAQAIAMRLSGIVVPRPMTHDLLLSSIEAMGGEVTRVSVSELKDNTFYATLHVRRQGEEITIDARPSDAIALAVRAGCPIFVFESVFAVAKPVTKPITEDEVAKFKADLEHLAPEDIFRDLGEVEPPDETGEAGETEGTGGT